MTVVQQMMATHDWDLSGYVEDDGNQFFWKCKDCKAHFAIAKKDITFPIQKHSLSSAD